MNRARSVLAALVATSFLLSACSASPTTPNGSAAISTAGASPTTRPSQAVGASQTVPPSPGASTGAVVPLAGEGTMFPGTYKTRFQPALTLTIGHEVDLDCVPGYQCRGDINVNSPGWLDLEFGNDHGSELMVIRLDKVFDPRSPDKLVDPPPDTSAWIASLPGLTLKQPAKAVTVGGSAATQFDAETGADGVAFGPTGLVDPPGFGIGPNTKVRLIALDVDGHRILILELLGPENIIRDFDAAADGLQSLVESIDWR